MAAGHPARAVGACAFLLVSVSLPAMASAQVAGEALPPERAVLDENGVNVATGERRVPQVDFVVGSGVGAMESERIYGRPTWTDARIMLDPYPSSGGTLSAGVGDKMYRFVRSGSGFLPASDGTRLMVINGVHTIISTNGTRYVFGFFERASRHQSGSVSTYDAYAYVSSIEHSNGLTETLEWQSESYCPYGGTYDVDTGPTCQTYMGWSWTGPSPQIWLTRLKSISNSAGYRIDYSYGGDFLGGMRSPTQAEIDAWSRLSGAQGGNAHGGTGPLPGMSYAFTRTPISGGYVTTTDATDALGRTTRHTMQYASNGSGGYTAVRRPGSGVDNERIDFSAGKVSAVTRDGATWNYAWSQPSATTSALTVTDPAGRARKYRSDLNVGLPTWVEDEYGRVTQYSYDANYRLATATSPAGQVTRYDYDAGGNVVGTTVTATNGATLSSSATYADVTCATVGTCNRMQTSTDVRGVVTTYGYDPAHGGMISATTANADGNSPSSQTRYSQVAGVWMPTRSWTCRTQATCENTGDAVQTSVQYNANLLPQTVTAGAGDNSLLSTTTMTYTAAGDVSTIDGPLPGAVDVTRAYHDAARQRLGVVGPDPDGPGVRARQATRINRDGWGRQTSIEAGTAADQSDGALGAMAVVQTQGVSLDDAGRPLSSWVSAGGSVVARTDYSYDAAGRSVCTAVRIAPGALGGRGDPCAAGGTDRVTRMDYGAPGSPANAWTKVTSGYGMAEASTERMTETATGKPATTTDGNGNVTTYSYDGFDRPSRTTFPGGSFEEIGYDVRGDARTRRMRDGQVIGYNYDALGRLAQIDRPNAVYWEADRSFGYDLLGRLTRASDSNGRVLDFGYDALGRRISQSDNWYGFGNATMHYDAGGRRERLSWGDGFFVTYDYDADGAMRRIREHGGLELVRFDYDALGRRQKLVRANGTETVYEHDPAGRLRGVRQDLAGTVWDVTLGYDYNPAGQIVTRTLSKDSYAFGGAYNVERAYQVNGLNQYTQAGPVALGYDGRGNLTSSGGTPYVYTADNEMVIGGGVGLPRDPLGRLFHITGEAGRSVTLLSNGAATLGEIDNASHAILRRYVYGPGGDEPVVWYEGAGTADRRWLHADERGSVIAVSDGAGNAVAVNRYDEFGIPAAGNVGRFQYTGQKWLPSVGLYDYKARMYSPTLGRFMQTDPIGYADGMNMYDYVGGDAVNMVDPSGTRSICGPGKRVVNNRDRLTGQTQTSSTEPRPGDRCEVDTGEPDIERWAKRIPQSTWDELAFRQSQRGDNGLPPPSPTGSPQSLQRNGQKPPSHDGGDPDYNRDLNKCRALADAGNRAAASRCYSSAQTRKDLRDGGTPESQLPPLITWKNAAGVAGGVAVGTILYWVISEGSRVLFPPRNLIPVP